MKASGFRVVNKLNKVSKTLSIKLWRFTKKPEIEETNSNHLEAEAKEKKKECEEKKEEFTENSQFTKVIFYKNIKFCFLLIVVERILRRKGGRSMMSLKKWVMTRSKWSKENSFKEKHVNIFEVIKRNYLGKARCNKRKSLKKENISN